jgi:hypothetical protein
MSDNLVTESLPIKWAQTHTKTSLPKSATAAIRPERIDPQPAPVPAATVHDSGDREDGQIVEVGDAIVVWTPGVNGRCVIEVRPRTHALRKQLDGAEHEAAKTIEAKKSAAFEEWKSSPEFVAWQDLKVKVQAAETDIAAVEAALPAARESYALVMAGNGKDAKQAERHLDELLLKKNRLDGLVPRLVQIRDEKKKVAIDALRSRMQTLKSSMAGSHAERAEILGRLLPVLLPFLIELRQWRGRLWASGGAFDVDDYVRRGSAL